MYRLKHVMLLTIDLGEKIMNIFYESIKSKA